MRRCIESMMCNVLLTAFREQSQESHTSVVLSNASFYRVHKLEFLAIWRWNFDPKNKGAPDFFVGFPPSHDIY